MRNIAENRFLDAFLKLILFSGILHLVIVVIAGLRQGSLRPLNYFSIIGLDQIFPRLNVSFFSHVLALSTALIIYTIILFYFRNKY
jgi:hypothetical protein